MVGGGWELGGGGRVELGGGGNAFAGVNTMAKVVVLAMLNPVQRKLQVPALPVKLMPAIIVTVRLGSINQLVGSTM